MNTFARLLPEFQKEIKTRVLRSFHEKGVDADELQEHEWRVELSCSMSFEVAVDAKTRAEAIDQAIAEAEETLFDDPDWFEQKVSLKMSALVCIISLSCVTSRVKISQNAGHKLVFVALICSAIRN